MTEKSKKVTAALILLVTLFLFTIWSASTPWIGWCPESNFTLSSDSKFPKWFSVPPGYDKKDLAVEIYYYAPPPPISSNFKTILLGPPPEHKTLDKKIGTVQWHPATRSYSDYPSYHIVNVNGTIELIEHKKMEPIFYVSDNTEMRQAIANDRY
jgi:hypothetical protein